jgi:hypothetical protein
MGKINVGRVIVGGLLAGLVVNIGETILNVPVLGAQMEAALRALNLPPVGGSTIAVFVVLCFALGIAMIWLYAAIRPRFGASAKTAACAGLFVWFFSIFFPSVGYVAMGFMPAKLVTIAALWELVEIVVAAIAGAWLYKE